MMPQKNSGLLNDTHYELAEKNGICRKTVHTRFYTLGWEVEEAITTPLKNPNKEYLWAKYKDVSVVACSTFYKRVSEEGMSPEDAALTPKRKKSRLGTGRFTREHVRIASENGIGYSTLHSRVYIQNWPVEKAITHPVKSNGRKKERNETTSN